MSMEAEQHYRNVQSLWEQHHHEYRALHQILRIIVKKANLNKTILCHTELSNNDKEIHRHRFDDLVSRCNIIDDLWKRLDYNYDSKRIHKIKTILKAIRNYDKERATQ